MFSANENIMLRQHKRRIVDFVESTIPESALEMGTAVMVMQASCRDPGCVPLETCVTIVFPRPPRSKANRSKSSTSNGKTSAATTAAPDAFPEALVPGLEESRIGGAFKTKILMPMSDVRKDDVLDALPPQFEGGRRTMEKMCRRARDVMLAQMTQVLGDDEAGRMLMAEYLQKSLKEYMERKCVAPEYDEAFSELDTAPIESLRIEK